MSKKESKCYVKILLTPGVIFKEDLNTREMKTHFQKSYKKWEGKRSVQGM